MGVLHPEAGLCLSSLGALAYLRERDDDMACAVDADAVGAIHADAVGVVHADAAGLPELESHSQRCKAPLGCSKHLGQR